MPKSSSNQIAVSNNGINFEIVDAENKPLINMCKIEGQWNESTQPEQETELDSESIGQLNHWISSLPEISTAWGGNSKHLMTCSVEYSQLVQAKDGSGAIGAINKGDNKVGHGNARFNEVKELKSIVNINLIVNIASQILAQKHLADINEHLKTIEKKIDKIQIHLEKKRISNINALREQLHIIGMMLRSGDDLINETLQTLAIRVQDVRRDAIHLKDDMETAISEVEKFDPVSLFGSNDIREALKKKIDNIERLQHEYFSGMQCLVMANLILFIKNNGNKEFILANELYFEEMNNKSGFISRWDEVKKIIKLHLSKMKPLFERAVSTNANALQITQRIKQTDEQLDFYRAKTEQLKKRTQEVQLPKFILDVSNGKILKGRHLF